MQNAVSVQKSTCRHRRVPCCGSVAELHRATEYRTKFGTASKSSSACSTLKKKTTIVHGIRNILLRGLNIRRWQSWYQSLRASSLDRLHICSRNGIPSIKYETTSYGVNSRDVGKTPPAAGKRSGVWLKIWKDLKQTYASRILSNEESHKNYVGWLVAF
jgi:hypothetical protein